MTEQKQQREQFDRHLEQAGNRLGTTIHDLWLGRDETLWSADPWFHLRLAGVADDLGIYFDVAAAGSWVPRPSPAG